MSKVVQFRKPRAAEKARGKTLCRRGFHKWDVQGDTTFDSKQGRLVTAWTCSRCGATRARAT